MKRQVVPALFFFALTTLLSVTCIAQSGSDDLSETSWTQLRGSTGSGVANAKFKPATKIDLDKQTVWSTDLPGIGWSTPVYQDKLIWLTTSVATKATEAEIAEKLKGDPMARIKTMAKTVELRAIAVDKKSGKLVHNILLQKVGSPEPINPMNSYASPTSAIHNGRVVCHFGGYGTWCLDATSGKPLWDTKYVIKHSVGPGSSPVIYDNKVILVCDGTDQQFIAAVDLKSGKEVWKTSRPPIRSSNGEYRKAYSTPILIDVKGQQQLVIPGAQWVAGYDLANGHEVWRVDHGRGFSVTPMPIFRDGLVIFSTGYTRPEFVAVDPTGKGDVTKTHVKWKVKGAPTMPSFIADQGAIYSLSDRGIMQSLDVKTGKLLGKKRVSGNFSSSPLWANGYLYCGDRNGKLSVVASNPQMEKISTTQFDSSIMATPILIGDDLLIRTEKRLIRIKP